MRYRGTELKSVVTAIQTTVCDTTGAVTLINGIAEAVGDEGRIGRQVTLKSVEVHGWNYSTASTGTDQGHRVLVVYDKQTNGAAPAITDILETVHPIDQREESKRTRFIVLMDKAFSLSRDGVAGDSAMWKFYKKIDLPEEFRGTAAAVTSISMGGLYVITLGDQAAGSSAGSCKWSATVRYTDP